MKDGVYTKVDQTIFQIENLKVTYGFRTAVDGISLRLDRGSSLGLLGLNGAGKTSTIRALLGMLRIRNGKVKVFAGKPGGIEGFGKIGFAPEEGQPPAYLNGEEYLSFVGGFRMQNATERRDAIRELLTFFELDPKKRISQYSKGMKRRIIMAQALLGSPELLILDEPLNGLDPLLIMKLRKRLEEYRMRGGTILFSSHILTEVEKTCSEVAILHKGKLACWEKLEALLKEFGSVEKAFALKVGVGEG